MKVLRATALLCTALIAAFVLSTSALVAALRFIDPPTTSVRLMSDKPSKQQWMPLQHISPALGLAVIASEDQHFFSHAGFDWRSIKSAFSYNQQGKKLRGGSTITQQTAKNLFLWRDRSWLRKGVEAYFTVLIEIFWPKPRILEMYLNVVEFGPDLFGAEAASQYYFNKPAKKLSQREAARMAAVLPNPGRYRIDRPGPFVQKREQWVMQQMRQLGGLDYLHHSLSDK